MRLTTQNKPVAERILERREQFFFGIENLTDLEIELLSNKWHAIANRYQTFIAKILLRGLERNN
jgi:hypothetical protein